MTEYEEALKSFAAKIEGAFDELQGQPLNETTQARLLEIASNVVNKFFNLESQVLGHPLDKNV